jgi:RHS repeat-associated protein
LNPVAELDAQGNVTARFVYASRAHVPEYIVKGGTTYRLVTDHLGSVRLVVDTTDGSVAQRLDYDAFGNVLQDTNPGFQPVGYAGGLYDPATELVRFGARDYDPRTGRWTAKDPIGFNAGDGNLYRYVGGDPVNRVDSNGLEWYDGISAGTLDTIGNASAGFGDALLLGFGDDLRSLAGVDDVVDTCSSSYTAGLVAGTVFDLAVGSGVFKHFWKAKKLVIFKRFGWSAELLRYTKHSKGVGLNFYKAGKRKFAVEWHRFHRKAADRTKQIVNRPHYHLRREGPGQGIKRHRPWDVQSDWDSSWLDRF